MSQVKDLNAKLSRIGTTIEQPRHDLHASVSHKQVEVKDKPELVQEDDVNGKIEEGQLGRGARAANRAKGKDANTGPSDAAIKWEVKDTQLNTTAKDGYAIVAEILVEWLIDCGCRTSHFRARITAEAQHGMISQILKDRLFNSTMAVTTGSESIIPEGVTQTSR